ncbi:MAG: universal stress protein, partial [Bacilli bacterium]
YVLDSNHVKADVLHNWNKLDRTDIRKIRVIDVEEKATSAGVKFETIILQGEPGPVIVKYANENEVDLIVLGSRGLNALQEFVLGSVSHKVAKRANCPVMIVK